MADAVGQQRPGATLYSSIGHDPAGYALAWAHAFIAGNRYDQVPVPRDPSLFAYLQPELVKGSVRGSWPYAEPVPSAEAGPDPEVRSYYDRADVIPTWLAATERYIESNVARLAATSADASSAPSAKQAYEQGAEQALAGAASDDDQAHEAVMSRTIVSFERLGDITIFKLEDATIIPDLGTHQVADVSPLTAVGMIARGEALLERLTAHPWSGPAWRPR